MLLNNYKHLSDEEQANVLSHLVPLLLVILLAPFFISGTAGHLEYHSIIGYTTFIIFTIFTFFSSVRYHISIELQDKIKWRRVDHICIYLMIGSSYTAYILRFMYTDEGLMFLGLHWFIILLGILKKIWFTGRFEFISVASYLFLGWMVLFIYDDITAHMNIITYQFLWLGAASYTFGVIFYVWEKLKYHHLIWHIFVALGTACHLYSLWLS